MLHTVFELALVTLAIGPSHISFAVEFVIREVSTVFDFVGEEVDALALLDVFQELAGVFVAGRPGFCAGAVGGIVEESA